MPIPGVNPTADHASDVQPSDRLISELARYVGQMSGVQELQGVDHLLLSSSRAVFQALVETCDRIEYQSGHAASVSRDSFEASFESVGGRGNVGEAWTETRRGFPESMHEAVVKSTTGSDRPECAGFESIAYEMIHQQEMGGGAGTTDPMHADFNSFTESVRSESLSAESLSAESLAAESARVEAFEDAGTSDTWTEKSVAKKASRPRSRTSKKKAKSSSKKAPKKSAKKKSSNKSSKKKTTRKKKTK